ncbi:uncharacterized protein LOC135848337 [Planococcus citri]|uniref:uncharacterized protein LOC135848337 n=1 Tax=Planococcus citri TaxID=170843 RepID=UPI0031F98C81
MPETAAENCGSGDQNRYYNIIIPDYKVNAPGGITTWINQVETRFKLAKMTSEEDKFDHMVASLPHEITNRVFNIINNPPTVSPFTTLKDTIIKEFKLSDAERVKKLLKGISRGDRKPSEYFREMKALAKDKVTDDVLREMFLAQLPKSAADILTVLSTTLLDELAKAADKL